MTFYNPFLVQIGKTPTIVYPSLGLEKVMDRNQPRALINHLRDLYDGNSTLTNPIIGNPNYNIDVVWNDGDDIMTDVWIFAKLGKWGSGPLVDVETFRGTGPETGIGKGCGNSLVMLGLEEQRRVEESIRGGTESYLKRGRADLPARLRVDEDFEIPSS